MLKAKQNDEQAGNSGIFNVLAGGTVITGSIVTESDFRLDGRIEGDIHCKGKIVIGPKGCIQGNVISENAEVLGTVEGSIRIREKLVLKSSAQVKGDIFIQILEVEPGANFNGCCTMSGKNPTEITDRQQPPKAVNLSGTK
jgi:cytoskeletal protein CcmA (bactofilin family)